MGPKTKVMVMPRPPLLPGLLLVVVLLLPPLPLPPLPPLGLELEPELELMPLLALEPMPPPMLLDPAPTNASGSMSKMAE